ncbi:MAG: lytic transglycosylase domain-containing protein [Nitrosomonadales bacterium]|nr:lytic transglycosylase domain-containing protein [Nitrosomonadales bacterium]
MAATLGIGHPAEASVYSFTANDGTVNLSNVPADDRYQLLVRAPVVKAAAPEANPSPAIAKKARYDRAVEKVAVTYGLDSALLHAVITVESRYRSKAVSRKGAAGLMQLMPNIVRRYGVADPLDPLQNLHGGARYLQYLLKRYDNDVSLALAAYNSGETAVAKYGNRIPPYRETTNYVPQVLDLYRKYRGESF